MRNLIYTLILMIGINVQAATIIENNNWTFTRTNNVATVICTNSITNTNGWSAKYETLTNITYSVSNNLTINQINTIIQNATHYSKSGKTIEFKFAPGVYTNDTDVPLKVTGFDYAPVYISGEPDTTFQTNYLTIIDMKTNNSPGVRAWYNSNFVMRYFTIKVSTAPPISQSCIELFMNKTAHIDYCYLEGNGTTGGGGIRSSYNYLTYLTRCHFNNLSTSVTLIQGLLTENQCVKTNISPVYGFFCAGGRIARQYPELYSAGTTEYYLYTASVIITNGAILLP